MIRFE